MASCFSVIHSPVRKPEFSLPDLGIEVDGSAPTHGWWPSSAILLTINKSYLPYMSTAIQLNIADRASLGPGGPKLMSPKKDAGLTGCQHVELDALAPKSDDDIDTSDIPEVREFSNPRRGMFASSPSRRARERSDLLETSMNRLLDRS